MEKHPNPKVAYGVGALLIILLASGAYAFGRRSTGEDAVDNTVAVTTPTPSATASATASPTPSPTADPTATWKTMNVAELGASFKYPSEWTGFKFIKSAYKTTGDLAFGGSSYGTFDLNTGPTEGKKAYLDITATAKDYKPYLGKTFSTQVRGDWTAEQLDKADEGFSEALLVKKLSDKALFAAEYGSLECSPSMIVHVLAPFTKDYPNLKIDLDYDVSKEPEVVSLVAEREKKGLDGCDLKAGYQAVVDRWSSKGFPATLSANMLTAQRIADSVTVN